MTISLSVKLTKAQIEDAIRLYITKELPNHTIDGNIVWSVIKGGGDMRESWNDSVNHVEFKVVSKPLSQQSSVTWRDKL